MEDPLASDMVFMTRDRYATPDGVEVTHAQQYYRGLRVHGSSRVVMRQNGLVLRVTPELFELPPEIDVRPTVTPVEALAALVTFLKRRRVLRQNFRFTVATVQRNLELVEQPTLVDMRYGFAETVRAHLEVFPEPDARARITWVIELGLKDTRLFHAVVSATHRAKVLAVFQTNTCAFQAIWKPLAQIEEIAQCPFDVLDTPTGAVTPPSIWSAGLLASGPNVECYASKSVKPDALGTALIDNAFVWCNALHDFFEAYGFDDAHHAFALTDPLIVVRQKGSDKRAGDFQYRKDGERPELRLFDTTHAGGFHAALDPSIVIHEYTHGVSSRLVGGSAVTTPFTTIESMGISEGISDYFALTVLGQIARRRQLPEPRLFGDRFRPGGMRSYVNFVETMPQPNDIYKIGEVWCAALLDGRDAIATSLGPALVDRADRFVWRSCIRGLMTVEPDLSKKVITSTTMKRAILEAAALIEPEPGFAGASAALESGFTRRNIA